MKAPSEEIYSKSTTEKIAEYLHHFATMCVRYGDKRETDWLLK